VSLPASVTVVEVGPRDGLVKTGVDLARLCEASRFLQSTLPGVNLPSRVFQAGPPKPRGPISG